MDDQRSARHRLRIARPVSDLEASTQFYEQIVGLVYVGGFEGHAGYSGAFLGPVGADWHFELTYHESRKPKPSPTHEDLIVLYLSAERRRWLRERIDGAGIALIDHPNPYWAANDALVFADPDGYLIVAAPERND